MPIKRFRSTLEATAAVWVAPAVLAGLNAPRIRPGTKSSLATLRKHPLENPPSNGYRCGMVIQSIREFNRSVPFKPYEIQMASGERFEVPHPDFISISPRGSFVVLIDAKDRPHHLSAILIERASLLNGHPRRKTGKR